jgi:hypothetical protein
MILYKPKQNRQVINRNGRDSREKTDLSITGEAVSK